MPVTPPKRDGQSEMTAQAVLNAVFKYLGTLNGCLKVTESDVSKTNLCYEMVYVEVADEGTPDYVSGSAGQIKTIKVWETGAAVGSLAKLYTFKYQDATYPTQFTSLVITDSVV